MRHLVGQQQVWTQLEAFALQIHGSLNPTEVAYQIATEGRRIIDCDRVSVAFLGEGRAVTLRPLRGKARVFEVFRFLAEPRPERLTGLAAAARDYAGRLRGRGPLILISDLMDPGYSDALRDLAGTRCQLSVLHVLAPEELDPDVPPDARLVDNETGHGIEVTGDADLNDRYRARLGEWQDELAEFCSRRGGAYVSVPSDLDLSDLLFDVLRRRRVVE